MNQDLVSERERHQKHLDALKSFMEGVAYGAWNAARLAAVEAAKADLVNLDPVDRKSEIESFKIRGELRLLEAQAELFKGARETLEERIEEITNLLQPNADQQ